jgi:hypothetical protein
LSHRAEASYLNAQVSTLSGKRHKPRPSAHRTYHSAIRCRPALSELQ